MPESRQRDVLVLGESLIDIVHAADGTTVEHPGGSAANVAVALARLGRPVRFGTAWADDARGEVLRAHLAADGVELAGDPRVLARTATAAATLGADGAASYVFDLEWRLGEMSVGDPAFVHICSLGAVLEPGADQVLALLEELSTAIVSYDINARPAITGTGPDLVARVERTVAAVDLVKASDEDLAALYPDLELAEAASHLLGLGPAAVVVTRGGAGAVWLDRERTVEAVSLPVEVADTIGAGDTFGAAVLDALWDRGPLADLSADTIAEVLAHAARAAAVTVSRPGANPPYRHELS